MMKLSEAMRLGGMTTKQITGTLFRQLLPGGEVGTCALGSAAYAMGLVSNSYSNICARWPILNQEIVSPDIKAKEQLMDVIVGLNDQKNWTREQIADWLEKEVEPRFPQYNNNEIEVENSSVKEECLVLK